ncbi:hypothetical protein E6W39_37055 [Kitasatospora acidiphila]|uniref:Uncharacterized protein n=1 Tax=Kitasatospora acidiphila TaxID=2567942 RepID=A0A540WCT0_9ACTN|nr:hypothetical protein [Kitasatospora acidiphila]TQF06778.1 hypothetical protein E6W39_37055 [Kitasatospora acidiphila]
MDRQPPGVTSSSCPYCQHYDALAAHFQGKSEALDGVQRLREEHWTAGLCLDPLRLPQGAR